MADAHRLVVPEGDDALQLLDHVADGLLASGRPAVLAEQLDDLMALDFEGHPLARLVVGAACHEVYRGDPRATRLVEEAWHDLDQRRDARGLGLAANVRANLAFSRGDVDEAITWWQRCRSLLGDEVAVTAGALAHLSLEAYQAGNLRDAVVRAGEALAVVRRVGGEGEQIIPLVYLGLYHLHDGVFSRAEDDLAAAEAIWVQSGAELDRNEGPLIGALQGCLHALRGDQFSAEASFSRSLALSEELETPWYAVMARCMRAEFTAHWTPIRALDDARYAMRQALIIGDEWWAALSLMSEGIASREAGRLAASTQLLNEAVEALTNPIEKGRALLALGETELRAGRRDAAATPLMRAQEIFEASGARYHEARACTRLAEAVRDRGSYWRGHAVRVATEDVAAALALGTKGTLRVSLVGPGEVTLAGRPVQFITRHAELALYLLTLAGPSGIAANDLGTGLWPTARPKRISPRLRTMLWQMRNGLGPEAWRLDRRAGRIVLDLTDVEVLIDLDQPVLEDWCCTDALRTCGLG